MKQSNHDKHLKFSTKIKQSYILKLYSKNACKLKNDVLIYSYEYFHCVVNILQLSFFFPAIQERYRDGVFLVFFCTN